MVLKHVSETKNIRACGIWRVGGERKVCRVLVGQLIGTGHLDNLGIDERVILK
jgi:hypothetical protein